MAKPRGKGSISAGRNALFQGGVINVDESSEFHVGENFKNCSFIRIENSSRLIAGDGCIFKNVHIELLNGAELILGDGVIVTAPWSEQASISINNGRVELKRNVRIFGQIKVRFAGRLVVGDWTGIGVRSEIRCEDSISIGSYGLISYDVSIFDTNAHSTDWRERRKAIERGYPPGVQEYERPATKAIRIGDDVWIGKGASVAKGASIGNRVIVGMNTNIGSSNISDDSVAVSSSPKVFSRVQAI